MGLENKVKKLMNYYESNSFNNSLNRFFVTGEDITVYASLNEDAILSISTLKERLIII